MVCYVFVFFFSLSLVLNMIFTLTLKENDILNTRNVKNYLRLCFKK